MKIFGPFLRLPRWLLTSVCLALILYLTLYPKPLPDNDFQFWEHTDKIVHAIMFGALYVCAGLDLWRGRPARLRVNVLLVVAVIAFGGVIEMLQQVMGMGRGGSVADWLADWSGAVLALMLLRSCSSGS